MAGLHIGQWVGGWNASNDISCRSMDTGYYGQGKYRGSPQVFPSRWTGRQQASLLMCPKCLPSMLVPLGLVRCQGHSSFDAPSELNPPQRIPSPLLCTTSATNRGLTIVLTCYSSRLFNVHVGRVNTYNSECFVNQSTQSQSWCESRNPACN